jgi:hypothetical protein
MTDATLPFFLVRLPNGSPLLIKLQLKDRQKRVLLPLFDSRQKAVAYQRALRSRLPQIEPIDSQDNLLDVLDQAAREGGNCVVWNPKGSSQISMETYDIPCLQQALTGAEV